MPLHHFSAFHLKITPVLGPSVRASGALAQQETEEHIKGEVQELLQLPCREVGSQWPLRHFLFQRAYLLPSLLRRPRSGMARLALSLQETKHWGLQQFSGSGRVSAGT